MDIEANELYVVYNDIHSEVFTVTGKYKITGDEIHQIGEKVLKVKNPKVEIPVKEGMKIPSKIELDGEYIVRIQYVITFNQVRTILLLVRE